MSSTVAIARGIAELDAAKPIKDALSAIFNLELAAPSASPVTKAAYIKELESRFEAWAPEPTGGDK